MDFIRFAFSIFLLLHLAESVTYVSKYKSLIQEYEMWEGTWAGTDAHGAAKLAYDDMVSQRGTANMMACAADQGYVYCASSAVGGSTGKPYPTDFEAQAKRHLDECARQTRGTHNRNARCAEPMLLNLLAQHSVSKPTSKVSAYGLGRGSVPQYHTPCLDLVDKNGNPTFGCDTMLGLLGIGWTISGKSPSQSPSPSRPKTPDRPASRSSSGKAKRSFYRKRDEQAMLLELRIRDMAEELLNDFDSLQARKLYSITDEQWD